MLLSGDGGGEGDLKEWVCMVVLLDYDIYRRYALSALDTTI